MTVTDVIMFTEWRNDTWSAYQMYYPLRIFKKEINLCEHSKGIDIAEANKKGKLSL